MRCNSNHIKSYLLDLQSRVNEYERGREAFEDEQAETVETERSTSQASPPQESPPRSLPSQLQTPSSETSHDDIYKNPLFEGTAKLVENPQGEHR